MKKSDKYKLQTTAADLSTEQDKKRLKYQQLWYMHDFKDAGTALYDRNRVVFFFQCANVTYVRAVQKPTTTRFNQATDSLRVLDNYLPQEYSQGSL
jgi:hypothetical protein